MNHMEPKKRSQIDSQNGATAVEFAIVLPMLLLLIFGIIEFSLYLFNKQVITNATREGARVGIVVRVPVRVLADENTEIEDTVRQYAENHLVTFGAEDQLTVTVLPDNRCMDFDCELIVQSDFNYGFLFLSTIGVGPTDIRAVARMRLE